MNICVFCGSSVGNDVGFSNTTSELGKLIGINGHTLIYGGGNIGLMGVLADSVLHSGGKVIGVIPDFLFQKEVAHTGITELVIVASMHERKQRMANHADVFLALPGGWGTLDELAEILTWRQLGIISKPIGLLNTKNFFGPLLKSMEAMVMNGFLRADNFQLLQHSESSSEILTLLGVALK